MASGRSHGGNSSTRSPFRRISPASGRSNPASMRRVVVLPQPEGPRIEKNSPGATSNDTPSTATVSPKRLRTRVNRMAGG